MCRMILDDLSIYVFDLILSHPILSANAVVVQIYLYIRYLMTIVAEAAAAIDISPIHQTSSNYLYTTLQKLLQYI